jgi:hypothetical protein
MNAKRRTRPPKPLGRFVVSGLLWLAIGGYAWGFARLTQIALYRQAHGVIGAEHPYDWGADGCLVLAMAAAALLLLTRPAGGRAWRKARRAQSHLDRGLGRAKRAKRRRERVQ